MTDLLTPKELADALKRCTTYVWLMRRRGFSMPGGRATLRDALIWLENNPFPARYPRPHRHIGRHQFR